MHNKLKVPKMQVSGAWMPKHISLVCFIQHAVPGVSTMSRFLVLLSQLMW